MHAALFEWISARDLNHKLLPSVRPSGAKGHGGERAKVKEQPKPHGAANKPLASSVHCSLSLSQDKSLSNVTVWTD